MAKPNKDGWMRHSDGICPVPKGTLIDVRRRDRRVEIGLLCGAPGTRTSGSSVCNFWQSDNDTADIMAWRPSAVKSIPSSPCGEIYQPKQLDPTSIRRRVLDIDLDCKKLYQELQALEEEKAELLVQLKSQGFLLTEPTNSE